MIRTLTVIGNRSPALSASGTVGMTMVGGPGPYSSTGSGGGSRALPAHSVVLLRTWMLSQEHFAHPDPTDSEKDELAAACGISVRQVRWARGCGGEGASNTPLPLHPPLHPSCRCPSGLRTPASASGSRSGRAQPGERIPLVSAGRLGYPSGALSAPPASGGLPRGVHGAPLMPQLPQLAAIRASAGGGMLASMGSPMDGSGRSGGDATSNAAYAGSFDEGMSPAAGNLGKSPVAEPSRSDRAYVAAPAARLPLRPAQLPPRPQLELLALASLHGAWH